MSMSTLLDIGGTGLAAQRIALDVTGENITNVNTPGYTKQTANLVTGRTTVVNGLATGSGVQVSTIQRAYDSFLQNELVSANAVSGQANATNLAMQTIQPLFNDLSSSGSDGLSGALQNFFSSWQDLASNPQGIAERQSVIADGQELVDAFHQISGGLTSVQDNMNQNLVGITSDINSSLQQVASLNSQIKLVEAQGNQANELEDQRDLLLQKLSQKMGVTAVTQSDGTVTVSLPAPNGQTLVSENQSATLTLSPNAANNGYYDVMLTPVGGATVNATSFIGGTNNSQGAIGATLQMRDTTVPKYLSSLNELASTLATQVNSAQSSGYGLNGSTGVNFFSGTTAAGLQLNINSTDQVAAASTDPTTGGTGNNINAQKVANIYDQAFPMTGGNMTLGDFYTSLMGTVGVDVQSASNGVTQTTSTLNTLGNLRDSESGVSLDEELTNLTKYQTAYQGAAKLITTGTQMLDTLLGMVQ